MQEFMNIVNNNDEVIGTTSKDQIYEQKHTHRIVHVLVVNKKRNQVYFQVRSNSTKYLPGYYCTSAGGHVQAGETYEQAAKRKLEEEIGLKTPITFLDKQEFHIDNHKRFMGIYLTEAESVSNFTDGEVSNGIFLDLDSAYKLIQNNQKIHPQLKVIYEWFYNKKHMKN